MPAYSGKTKISQVSVMGDWWFNIYAMNNQASTLHTSRYLISHSFLILPKCPTPTPGKDILSKFKASITIQAHLLI